jgi:glycine cleavage system H lipoate-binding protein
MAQQQGGATAMTCPFLKEAQVKYCQASSIRKLIPIEPASQADEKCSSQAYLACPVYGMQSPAPTLSGHCPYLGESLMQYCGAAPAAKMIPYSESRISRCGCDRFRYCELYLSTEHPRVPAGGVDGIPLPAWLHYSANHMWLDIGEDGVCHAGIDAFLGRALGQAERISYVWERGQHRATAVVTVNGVDHAIVFPNPFLLTGCNLYLRADPARLTAEPYTGGWLFEGVPTPETSHDLLQGAAARHWMKQEQRRINQFLQQQPGPHGPLDRDRMLALFHTFFAPYASRTSPAEGASP